MLSTEGTAGSRNGTRSGAAGDGGDEPAHVSGAADPARGCSSAWVTPSEDADPRQKVLPSRVGVTVGLHTPDLAALVTKALTGAGAAGTTYPGHCLDCRGAAEQPQPPRSGHGFSPLSWVTPLL